MAQSDISLPELVENLEFVTPPDPSALPWWWILAAVIGLLALLVPLYLVFRKSKKAARAAAEPRPDPALAANQRLQALRDSLGVMSQREAAIELASILRDYVCDRFEIRAPYQTTSEFIGHLGIAGHFPATQSDAINSLLQTTDLVKFASAMLRGGTIEEWIDYVAEFVRKTRPETPAPVTSSGEVAHG